MGSRVKKNTTPVVTLSDEQLDKIAEMVTTKIDAKLAAREKFVDTRLEELQDENDLLKDKTDDLEQRNRLENLRIFGVKEEEGENTDTLVLDVAAKLDLCSISKTHISRSHRVGKKSADKPRAIIVKFVSYATRQEIFMAKKKLKGSGISIREDLTSIRQAILTKAYDNFDEVWSQGGVIIIKDGKKFHRIRTMKKLDELIGK
ncbi:Glycine amidinotransferase, mitochondrial [Frankliniella fusca]|uniref:Glycine amidinotransferase, mitochondrial n=1 Tax=Frankliniella fusca TaxID=407009 RepID=A0AAE1LT05_9NEOP|nr:Glycine amidinotransferase, mitochondrial [Frankliniella fusca]